MRSLTGIILIVIFIVAAVQLFHLFIQNRNLKSDLSEIDRNLTAVSGENLDLGADLEYLANSDNLAKELRGKLNYKIPGEKLIILVPPPVSD